MAFMNFAPTRAADSSQASRSVNNARTARHQNTWRRAALQTVGTLNIKICHDIGGTWSVQGTSPVQVSFSPVCRRIEYPRKACNAAPATTELYVDGMYIVAHQDNGWPKKVSRHRSAIRRRRHSNGSAVTCSDGPLFTANTH
jgi:hypothetical protein